MEKLRYNLDEDGLIKEIGFASMYPHYKNEMEDNTVDFSNYLDYRLAGKTWVKKSEK
jgi:hypothetical protein